MVSRPALPYTHHIAAPTHFGVELLSRGRDTSWQQNGKEKMHLHRNPSLHLVQIRRQDNRTFLRRHLRAELDLTALAGDRRRRAGWIDGFVGDRSPANERDENDASGSVECHAQKKVAWGEAERKRRVGLGFALLCFACRQVTNGQGLPLA